MGGDGSTRWDWHCKARTVESCVSISTTKPREQSCHNIGVVTPKKVGLVWRCGLDAQRDGLFELIGAEGDWPRLGVTMCTRGTNANNRYWQTIFLESMTLPLGGKRFWFVCPDCKRRTAFLYLPPNASHFGCRVCYHLTYRSSQECHPPDLNVSLQRFYNQCDRLMSQSSKKSTA